ncbi:MAG: putative maltokinase [Acidobacteriota bacterium]
MIYYGDEIGMGDNIYLGDRDGVRTPMQWSPDRNAGFSFANPQQLYLPVIIDPQYNFAAVNVEIQRENPTSLWWWTKRMIGLRNRCRAFGRGSFELVHPSNPKILAFLRRWEDEIILVVANLSRHPQQAELDLSEFEGRTPVELSGNTAFESVRDMPYCASLNPYGFFWFALQPKAPRGTTPFTITRSQLPVLTLPRDGWEGALRGRNLSRLQGILPGFLKGCRWFASKSRTIDDVAIRDIFWIKGKVKADRVAVLLLRVDYLEAESELYVLPIACASGEEQSSILDKHPQAAVALIESPDSGRSGLLYDAAFSPAFPPLLLRMFRGRRAVGGRHGHLTSYRVSGAASTLRGPMEDMQPKLLEAEQSNTSILYGDRFILKLYRKLENGENPELEISRYLTHNAPDVSTPHLIGHLSYEVRTRPSVTVGVLQEFVPNHGDAWIYTLHVLDRFFERILANPDFLGGPPASYLDRRRLLDRALNEPKKAVLDMIGAYVESAHLLGRRTAELHKALARAESDPAFEPEPFTRLYQRSLFQSMSNLARSNFQLLQSHLKSLGVQTSSLAERVLAHRAEVFERFQRLRSGKMEAWRIRCHGDYHLGQVLNTGKDFVVIDFEGEPARSLGERQLKRSPFRDTAGMLRSFHYAAYQALKKQRELGLIQTDRESAAIAWADLWTKSVGAEFMRSYMECVAEEPLLAVSLETANLLLEAYLLDKAVYEVGYELNNRPEWVDIPLAGILWLVEGDS